MSTLKYKMLIICQKDISRQILEDICKAIDIETIVCHTTNEALELLEHDLYSLLIYSLLEDKEQNDKFVASVRSKQLFLDKPIISIIPNNKYFHTVLGVTDYIVKPLEFEKTKTLILNVIEKHYQQNILIEELFSQSNIHKKEVTKIQQKHEEEISLIKDRMLLIFTHELKTPLNAVINFADYINRGLQGKLTRKKIDRYIELSEIIKINGEVLLDEINTLLDIAKIKENRMVFNIDTVDLNSMINHSVYKYKMLYNKDVISSIDEVTIQTDKKSFEHIFENLFSNALKYSTSLVKVSLNSDNNKFILIVEDDGEGIEEDQRSKIFEIFEQTEETVLTRKKEGTGIGLYIVKLICDHFQYNIEGGKSKLGGAKFTISGIKNKG
ncbi:MAG: HAMP domain-containing sensor histidine kinase [Campylobacterota bacterium]|nr:HAMP domain-containing sensor histidine kinase [Campylobacterota bacterium]